MLLDVRPRWANLAGASSRIRAATRWAGLAAAGCNASTLHDSGLIGRKVFIEVEGVSWKIEVATLFPMSSTKTLAARLTEIHAGLELNAATSSCGSGRLYFIGHRAGTAVRHLSLTTPCDVATSRNNHTLCLSMCDNHSQSLTNSLGCAVRGRIFSLARRLDLNR